MDVSRILAQELTLEGFPGGSAVKYLPAMQENGFNPWVRKLPWRKIGNPLQYSCLGKSMDRGAWWVTVHGVERVRHDCATKQQQDKTLEANRQLKSESESPSVVSDSWQPRGLYSPWNSPGKNTEVYSEQNTVPFSRGSSQPTDQAQVSCIAGGFLTSWATREAQ